MGYSVKVKFPLDNSLEVSGDDVTTVIVLVNALTKKFFSNTPAIDVEISP